MRWKRIVFLSLAVAALALSLYAVSLAHARIRVMQTTETDRAETGEGCRNPNGIVIAFGDELEAA